jgi:hypothetical protein
MQIIENYLEQYKDGKMFSTILYMLDSQIDYIMDSKNIKKLDNISKIIKMAIKQHKESDKMLIF